MTKVRYRWRTWLRRRLPWFLVDWGVAGKGTADCGDHEWYNAMAWSSTAITARSAAEPFRGNAYQGAEQGSTVD